MVKGAAKKIGKPEAAAREIKPAEALPLGKLRPSWMKPKPPERQPALKIVVEWIGAKFPDLKKKLKEAGMKDEPAKFVAKTLVTSLMMSIGLLVLAFLLVSAFSLPSYAFAAVPVFFVVFFFWMMRYPDVIIKRRMRAVDRELLFAGRHILIELKAGVPLFNAMLSVSEGYGEVSAEFKRITEKISAGTPADAAMQEIASLNPSRSFRKIIFQMINSLRAGSDVANSLDAILAQVSQEQAIELKAYGQRLNPLTMFYMLFGIILPSLGIALAIIVTSFVNIAIDITMLFVAVILVALLQYMFLTMINASRPAYEL